MPTAAETLLPLERALDWLADGVALIGIGGRVLHANESFRVIAQRNDGIGLTAGTIRLAGAPARARLNGAIAAAFAARDPGGSSAADFAVPRADGALAYLVSVRPLLDHSGKACSLPCAVMFVRDPLTYRSVDIGALREVFALTEAEACLAKALQAGQSPADYAREHAVSLNTVYTHLRHLKDKTGCNRMTALIRKLNELQVPLRLSSAGAVVWTPNAPLTGARISPILVTPGLGAA